jgi:hypothetical protein
MNDDFNGCCCNGNREVVVFVDVFFFASSRLLFSFSINFSASFISSADNSCNENGSR